MKSPNWPVRGAIGAVSLIVVGGALGMMGHHLTMREGSAQTMFMGADQAALVSFRSVLELDDDQVAAIHEILLRHQTRVDDTWESLRVEIQAEVDSAHYEIRALLTDYQVGRFEAWLDRHVRQDQDGNSGVIWTH